MRDRDDRNRRSGGGGGQRVPDYMSWYEPRTIADVTQRLAQRQRSNFDSPYSKLRMYQPKDGANAVRILPPHVKGHYCYPVWEHRYVGSGNGTYLCLRKMKNQRCPICAEESIARRHGDLELAKKLAAKPRRLCYVLNRSKGAENPNQPLLWNMSDIQDEEILNLTTDEVGGAIFPEHPDTGYDLSFTRLRIGTDIWNVRYQSWRFARDSSPLSNDRKVNEEIMRWLKEHPIPDMLEWHEAKYLEEVMSGTAAEADEDLDQEDDERPSSKRSGLSSRSEERDDDPLPDGDEDEEVDDDREDDDRDDDEEEQKDEDEDAEEQEAADEDEADEAEEEDEPEPEPEPEVRTRRRTEEPRREERRAASSNGSRRGNVRELRPRPSSSGRRDTGSRFRPRD